MTSDIACYCLASTRMGIVGVVWRETLRGPSIQRVLLPQKQIKPEALIRAAYPGVRLASAPAIDQVCRRIRRFLDGQAVTFDLKLVQLRACGEFQRKVLLAEYGIPRGEVSTYKRIARRIGAPGAARAVGTALARNPFPIVIPCHRAVRSDGSLGGYQGGPAMKRTLLEMEGVEFDHRGRVVMRCLCY